MINYSYKITKINVHTSNNQLNSVEWWYVGEENEFKYEIYNVTQLKPGKTPFIPLENLEETDVIKFIEKSLDKDYIKTMKKIIKEEIERQKQPENTAITPPWLENV